MVKLAKRSEGKLLYEAVARLRDNDSQWEVLVKVIAEELKVPHERMELFVRNLERRSK